MEQFIQDLVHICEIHKISVIGEDIFYKDGELIEGEIVIIPEEESNEKN
ncbi:MAG: hypothetical protein ACRC6E_05580 [Fusobacteriaceae bacterium]